MFLRFRWIESDSIYMFNKFFNCSDRSFSVVIYRNVFDLNSDRDMLKIIRWGVFYLSINREILFIICLYVFFQNFFKIICMVEDELEFFISESNIFNFVLFLLFFWYIKDQISYILVRRVEKTIDEIVCIFRKRVELRKIGYIKRNIFIVFDR